MPKIETNDIQTYYEVHGEGIALVLIHGIGACYKMWQPQMEELSKHFNVVVYDVRGHGESSGSDGKYSLKLFASDLKVLLDKLGIEQAHICGLSMGGLVAQQFAIDYPTMVDKLVLVNTFWGPPPLRIRIILMFGKLSQRFVLLFISMERNAEIGAKGLFKKKGQEELRDFFAKEATKISKKELFKAMDATYSFGSLALLDQIEAPTLIIVGEEDKWSHLAARILHRGIKNSRVEPIPDAFHAVNLEKPAEFDNLVLDFLLAERR